MRAPPFWPVATLTWAAWLTAVALFWSSFQLPMPPLSLVPVIALFYVPVLNIGIWAGRAGTMGHWSRGRLTLTCVLGLVGFAPWALLTLPLLPLTLGALILSLGTLAWGWSQQRASTLTVSHR